MVPKQIKISEDYKLRIIWDNGSESKIGLGYLRKECPCAECKGENIFFEKPLNAKPSVFAEMNAVNNIKVVGSYAIQISWRDGHDKGIYRWDYLAELAVSEKEDLQHNYKPLI